MNKIKKNCCQNALHEKQTHRCHFIVPTYADLFYLKGTMDSERIYCGVNGAIIKIKAAGIFFDVCLCVMHVEDGAMCQSVLFTSCCKRRTFREITVVFCWRWCRCIGYGRCIKYKSEWELTENSNENKRVC